MKIYLMDVGKPINGLQIKKRYGKEFEQQKKFQNIARYAVYQQNISLGDFFRLSSAKKFCGKE